MFQREKCKLTPVNADEVDSLIYNDIVEVLSNPGSFAKDCLKDINVEELRNKVEVLRDRDKVLKTKLWKALNISRTPKTPICETCIRVR